MALIDNNRLASVMGIAIICTTLLLTRPALADCSGIFTGITAAPFPIATPNSTYCVAQATDINSGAQPDIMTWTSSSDTLNNYGIITQNNSNPGASSIHIQGSGTNNVLNNYNAITSYSDNNVIFDAPSNTINNNLGASITSNFSNGGGRAMIFSNTNNSILNNSGTITENGGTGTGSAGIIVAGNSNTITNSASGTISETGGAAESAAIILSGDSNVIENAGTISETGGTDTNAPFAISISGANNTITNQAGGSITSPSVVTINATGPNTTITNSGSISSSGVGKALIEFTNSGSITNTATGSILADTASNASNGEVTTAIVVDADVSITNQLGGAINSNSNAVAICVSLESGSSTVTNAGTITALSTSDDNVAYGIAVAPSVTVTNDITNTGTITAQGGDGSASRASLGNNAGSAGIWHAGTGSTITNSGTISETGGADSSAGIILSGNDNTINNLASGMITETGPGSASPINGASGILVSGTGNTINNQASATISQNALNTYEPTALGSAINLTGNNNTITNSGTIIANPNSNIMHDTIYGVWLNNPDGNILINQEGGVIKALNANTAWGVYSTSPNDQITNSGTISTDSGGSGAVIGLSGGSFLNTLTGIVGDTETYKNWGYAIVTANKINITNNGQILSTAPQINTYGVYSVSTGGTLVNTNLIQSTAVDSQNNITSSLAIAFNAVSGGNITIQNSGTITARGGSDSAGVRIGTNNNIINNSGTISETGGAAGSAGVVLNGNNNSVTNNAYSTISGINNGSGILISGGNNNSIQNAINSTVSTSGGSSNAPNSIGITGGASYSIENSGNITSSAYGGNGIMTEVNGTITNSGTISVTNTNYGNAILAQGVGVVKIVNSGTLSASTTTACNDGTYGVFFDGSATGTVSNTGTISANGGIVNIVQAIATGNPLSGAITVNNFGNISASGAAGSAGISFVNDGNVVNNYGTISETGGAAGSAGVILAGNSNTLNNANGGTISCGSGSVASAYVVGSAPNTTGNTINNSGIISGNSANGGQAVDLAGAGTLTNTETGQISFTGANWANGVVIEPTGNVAINNRGLISATQTSATSGSNFTVGVLFSGAGSLINSGTIQALDSNKSNANNKTVGLSLGGTGSLVNSGLITASGAAGSSGVNITSANKKVVNYGAISETGGAAGSAAIIISSTGNTVDNHGTISGAVGIVSSAENNTIDNHSTISGSSGVAVDMSGADNQTFNFRTTSNIIGKIKFSSGTGNTFNFIDKGSDRRYFIEYEGEATTNINMVDPILTISPSTITITSADSKQITTISKTVFVAASEIATQNARDVRNVIETRLDEFYLGRTRDHNRYNYWTKAFGTYQKREAAGWALPYKTLTGGVAVGFDKPVRENISIGFFVNSNVGRLRYGNPAYTTTSRGVAIGSYGQIMLPSDHFLEIMLSVGYNSIKNNSTVLQNNNANGAINIKSNNYEITALPSVSFGKRFECDYFNIVPSVSLHYTAQRISAINEMAASPTPAVQKVAARMLGTVGGKFQLALYNNEATELRNTDFNLKIGVEAKKLVVGKTVKVTALATEAAFSAGGAKHHIDGFIGGGVNFRVGNAGKIFTEVEVSKSLTNRSKRNIAASASLGFALDF